MQLKQLPQATRLACKEDQASPTQAEAPPKEPVHALSLSFETRALFFAKLALAEAVESAVHGRTDVSPFLPGWPEREIEGKHAVANRSEARESA